MKKHESRGWTKHIDFMLLDILCLQMAFSLVYYIKFGIMNLYRIEIWRNLAVVMTLIDLLIMVFASLLEDILRRGYMLETIQLVKQTLLLELFTTFYMYTVKSGDSYSRIVVLFTGVAYVVITFLVRSGWKIILQKRLKRHIRKQLLIGSGKLAECYIKQLQQVDKAVEVKIYLADHPREGIPNFKGDNSQLEECLMKNEVDDVVAVLDEAEYGQINDVINLCEKYGVSSYVVPYYNDVLSSTATIEQLGNLKLINIRTTPLDKMSNAMIKRTFDIIVSLILIILTSPIMLAAAIGTKLSSPGPILFRQERIGRNKKPYTMLKFRSMRITGTEETGWSTNEDPRKTKFGSFIRKYSIDELPQFFNVLTGQMSLIGPRPEVPFHVEHFKDEIPLYLVRQRIRPGITGWAQVNGLRGDTSIEERVKHDIWYIENWSLALDLKIVMKTIFGGMVNQEKINSIQQKAQ